MIVVNKVLSFKPIKSKAWCEKLPLLWFYNKYNQFASQLTFFFIFFIQVVLNRCGSFQFSLQQFSHRKVGKEVVEFHA